MSQSTTSPRSIHVTSVLHVGDGDPPQFFVDHVDHPEVASPSAVDAFQVEAERLADLTRIRRESSIGKLHAH